MGCPTAGGSPTRIRYAIVDLDRLRPHEGTEPSLLRETVDAVRADGTVRHPILVEEVHLVILDGHHRYEAMKVLGCRKAPVYLVDYGDDGIEVTTWPEAVVASVTKEEVVARGLRGDPFPPKTTRHIVKGELGRVSVPLDDLR